MAILVKGGSLDTILEGKYQLKTIPSNGGPNWLVSFRGKYFLNILSPIGFYVKTMSTDVSVLG